MKNIKRFNTFNINEGIDASSLNDEQKAALEELKSSDVSLFDDRDFQHYADKIGVSIEQVMELVGEGGTSTNNDSIEDEVDNSELEEIVRTELVDNPEVDSNNLIEKIDELVDRLEDEDYYDWDLDEEWDDFQGKYQTLKDVVKNIYNELTGVNNPNQIKMEFESKSIKKFNDFLNK